MQCNTIVSHQTVFINYDKTIQCKSLGIVHNLQQWGTIHTCKSLDSVHTSTTQCYRTESHETVSINNKSTVVNSSVSSALMIIIGRQVIHSSLNLKQVVVAVHIAAHIIPVWMVFSSYHFTHARARARAHTHTHTHTHLSLIHI